MLIMRHRWARARRGPSKDGVIGLARDYEYDYRFIVAGTSTRLLLVVHAGTRAPKQGAAPCGEGQGPRAKAKGPARGDAARRDVAVIVMSAPAVLTLHAVS